MATPNLTIVPDFPINVTHPRRVPFEDKLLNLIHHRDYRNLNSINPDQRGAYRIGVYDRFGEGASATTLRHDLSVFLEEVDASASPFLTYVATFPLESVESSWDFENRFENEFKNFLPTPLDPWDKYFSKSAAMQSFKFKGKTFVMVSLHPEAPNDSRFFAFPTFIINLYDQLPELSRLSEEEAAYFRGASQFLTSKGPFQKFLDFFKFGGQATARL